MDAALRKVGINVNYCPYPLNLWMNTPIVDNTARWLPPLSKPGDHGDIGHQRFQQGGSVMVKHQQTAGVQVL